LTLSDFIISIGERCARGQRRTRYANGPNPCVTHRFPQLSLEVASHKVLASTMPRRLREAAWQIAAYCMTKSFVVGIAIGLLRVERYVDDRITEEDV